MKIGIFGGTFNPPHIGHARAAQEALKVLELDLLIVIPSGIPPHKPLPANTPEAESRLYMTQIAFEGVRNTLISDFEIKNESPCYTIDTIKVVSNDYPGAQLFLFVGTDMYLTLDKWKDGQTIITSVIPVVFSREYDDSSLITAYSEFLLQKFNTQTRVINNNITEISSSKLREMLPERCGREYLAEKNYSYIISKRLYSSKPDWNWLCAQAYSLLDPARVPHVKGCEKAAVALAARWNVNEDDARESAILHDITKKLNLEGHRAILRKYGFDPQSAEFAEEKLLHAKTGAILAFNEYGSSNTVAEAIKWHTTGKENMTSLEKIIYLADYIEETRELDGLEELRILTFNNLDDAMIMGLEMSVADITGRGMIVNEVSRDALDYLITQRLTAKTKQPL